MTDYRDWIRPDILAKQAYSVPNSVGLIKLDAMENPYPLPEALWMDLAQAMQTVEINRYPGSASSLKDSIRETMDVPDGIDILLGNGSDELIQIVTMAIARPGAKVLSIGPTFSLYRIAAGFFGLDYVEVDLNTDFSLNLDMLLSTIEQERPALVFIAYPNNPTGRLFDSRDIEKIIQTTEGLVVVDEAYHVFSQQSFLDCVDRFDNLLVMRTISKLGLAGARFGFLCGAVDWLDQFDKVRLPYNVNSMTQCLVETVLPRIDLFEAQAADILKSREKLFSALSAMKGVTVFPSDANFLLFRAPNGPAVFAGLLHRGILIKSLHGVHRLLDDCLRVNAGTPSENAAFLSALKEILSEF